MIFAGADEFDRLLKELRDTLDGLGYADVYEIDLTNARTQTAAREAVAEKYGD